MARRSTARSAADRPVAPRSAADRGTVRRPGRTAALLALVAAGALVGGACSSGGSGSATSSTTAAAPSSTATTSGSAPTGTAPLADRDLVQGALLVADDLGTGWTPRGQVLTRNGGIGSTEGSLAKDCPDLLAAHPVLQDQVPYWTATSPDFARVDPPAQVSEVVGLLPDEAMAEQYDAAFADRLFAQCLGDSLGGQIREAGGKATVSAWDIGEMGDARHAYRIDGTGLTDVGTDTLSLGMALVRVGRAQMIVVFAAPTPVGPDQVAVVAKATDKLRSSLG